MPVQLVFKFFSLYSLHIHLMHIMYLSIHCLYVYGHWSHIHTNSAPQHLSMLSLHPTGIEYSTTSSCCMIYITDSTQEKEHSPHFEPISTFDRGCHCNFTFIT